MPVETMMTCTAGTKNVLDMAHDFKARVVQASTSEVYGDPTTSPQIEGHWGNVHSYGPRACYDEGKRAAEALCFDYYTKYGVDARLVRIFNTYGPNMDPGDGRVISNFICQALRGEQLTMYGDGKQSRSFCYVDDLIRGIVALGSLRDNPGTPVNVGNPSEFTINELASRVIEKVFGGSSYNPPLDLMVNRRPLPIDDPLQRCPDISLANRLLGWEPSWSLSRGLDETIAYFRRRV
jgi:UDP-glucuronate decarboxylase